LIDRHLGRCLANAAWALTVATALWGDVSPRSRDSFEVRVPEGWRGADRLMLLVKGVSLPKNRPVVFELYATDRAGDDLMLGSYGVVAESDTARGRWTLEVFQVNVTRQLRRWLEERPEEKTVRIRLEPVDGSRSPIHDLDWTARSVEVKAIRNR
jgi:hypothetical protein